MEHWHDCGPYREFGFNCPKALHEPERREQDDAAEEADEVAFPWEFLLPTATAVALRGILETYFFEDADADKIRRFPSPRKMPDIPEELAAIVAGIAFTLLLRGSARTLMTARLAERFAVSGLAVVPPGSARMENVITQTPVRRSTGIVESPFGKARGSTTSQRKKRLENAGGGQAGQFQSFGEWWYQGVTAQHQQNMFRGSERFDPAKVPPWIRTAMTRAQLARFPFGSGFNEQWEAEFGFGGSPPFAEGPGN